MDEIDYEKIRKIVREEVREAICDAVKGFIAMLKAVKEIDENGR